MLAFGFLGFAALVNGHSWIHCTDYRGDVGTYETDECFGHPRPKNGNFPDAVTFGQDSGHDTQNAVCQSTSTNNAQFPAATYQRGQTVTIAWPSKNHVAATCTNPFIPDTSTQLFVAADATGTTPTGLTQVPASFSDDPHENNVVDFKGFQNCPNFCDNTDKSLCTGTFVVPDTMADGTYTFQWSWVFNNGAPPYVSCFEATVAGEAVTTPVDATTQPPVNGPAPTPIPTTTENAMCGATGEQCDGALFSGANCCQDGLSCYRQSTYFSQCLPVTTGCPSDWECSETASCVAKGEQCGGEYHSGPTCCSSGSCFRNSPYYFQCRDNCPTGWECDDASSEFTYGMGNGGLSISTGFLVVFLLLTIGAIGVLYGRCWERKSVAKAAEEVELQEARPGGTSLDKLGESAKDLSSLRRSTLTMPKVDKTGKPKQAPPRPPARMAAAPVRPPTFRQADYVSEV